MAQTLTQEDILQQFDVLCKTLLKMIGMVPGVTWCPLCDTFYQNGSEKCHCDNDE